MIRHLLLSAGVLLVVFGIRAFRRRQAKLRSQSLDKRAESASINKEVAQALRERFAAVDLEGQDHPHNDDPDALRRTLQLKLTDPAELDTVIQAVQRDLLRWFNTHGVGCKAVEVHAHIPTPLRPDFDEAWQAEVRQHPRIQAARKMGCSLDLRYEPTS